MTEVVTCNDCVNREFCYNDNQIDTYSDPICPDFIPFDKEVSQDG